MIREILLAQAQDAEARAEGWVWWTALVLGLMLVLAVVSVLRRILVQPMPHTPSDLSDAWSEAGRRLPAPPPETPDDRPKADDEDVP
jgi:hypothetical protein